MGSEPIEIIGSDRYNYVEPVSFTPIQNRVMQEKMMINPENNSHSVNTSLFKQQLSLEDKQKAQAYIIQNFGYDIGELTKRDPEEQGPKIMLSSFRGEVTDLPVLQDDEIVGFPGQPYQFNNRKKSEAIRMKEPLNKSKEAVSEIEAIPNDQGSSNNSFLQWEAHTQKEA